MTREIVITLGIADWQRDLNSYDMRCLRLYFSLHGNPTEDEQDKDDWNGGNSDSEFSRIAL